MRTAGDGADHNNHYNSTTHTQESPDKADDINKGVATYAELKEETVNYMTTAVQLLKLEVFVLIMSIFITPP